MADAVLLDFGVGIGDGGTGGGGTQKVVLVESSSSAAAAAALVVGVFAEDGAAAAADARQLAAEEDPGEGVAEVLGQEDEEERVDVESGEDEAMRDDLDGDEGLGAGMRGHVLDEQQHLDGQPDHVEDEEDDDLRPRVSLFPAKLLLRRLRAGRETEDQMPDDETVQNDDEHEGAGKGTETTVHHFVLTRVDERVNVRTGRTLHAVRSVVAEKREGGGQRSGPMEELER